MHPIIYTENLVTSCPKLGELHELMILVVNGYNILCMASSLQEFSRITTQPELSHMGIKQANFFVKHFAWVTMSKQESAWKLMEAIELQVAVSVCLP